MCQEVLRIAQKMDQKHIETRLAVQCAPLIAGLKIANLLIVSETEASNLPMVLRKTGLVFLKLSNVNGRVTFLVFRREELRAYLEDERVHQILLRYGYEEMSFREILCRFMKRYQAYAIKDENGFPHEIGLLLGYPVEDVEGFIVHNGENFLYSGYWKVYGNVTAKKELFHRFDEAQRDIIALLAKGVGIRRIIKEYNAVYQMKLVG